MTKEQLEAMAWLAWFGEEDRCRQVYCTTTLRYCSLEEIPYYLGFQTISMGTAVWPMVLGKALDRYNYLEKQNEDVQQSSRPIA